ncbi:LysR family transcriptional regulator, partial [Campylobacter coli]
MRPKWARWPANRPDWPVQSLRRRVWATRFFENSVPDAFDAHFFNGLLG